MTRPTYPHGHGSVDCDPTHDRPGIYPDYRALSWRPAAPAPTGFWRLLAAVRGIVA
jgi:hypothetical protein